MTNVLVEKPPIIIIGAARSGTNILRDVLTDLPGMCTWPCDEINYIWRHGNKTEPSDEFSAEHANRSVVTFIRRKFAKRSRVSGGARVVEKTCANSLRVGFVDAVLPEARYIHIVRDGRDCVASAVKRWRGGIDPIYLARKARFLPFTDVPYYAFRFFSNRIRQVVQKDHSLPTWGPRFAGMDRFLETAGLLRTVARQWSRCVERARMDFRRMEGARVHSILYEQFVSEPKATIEDVLGSLGMEDGITGSDIERSVRFVRSSSVGRWAEDLSDKEMESIRDVLDPTLRELGYVDS